MSKLVNEISPTKIKTSTTLVHLSYKRIKTFFFKRCNCIRSFQIKKSTKKKRETRPKHFQKVVNLYLDVHAQPIPNVLPPNKVRDIVKPKKIMRSQG